MKNFFIFLAFFFLLGSPVYAQTDLQKQTEAFAGSQGASFGAPRDPRIVVAYTIQILLMLVGMIFLVYTIYAGYLILMARGDEEQVTKGKETLRTAIIGMLIVLASYSITLLAARVATGGKAAFDPFFRQGPAAGSRSTNVDVPIIGNVDVEVKEDYSQFIKRDPLQ